MNGRKGYEKEKKKQQLHELHAIHSRGTRFKSFVEMLHATGQLHTISVVPDF
jgi:hypothetical protein